MDHLEYVSSHQVDKSPSSIMSEKSRQGTPQSDSGIGYSDRDCESKENSSWKETSPSETDRKRDRDDDHVRHVSFTNDSSKPVIQTVNVQLEVLDKSHSPDLSAKRFSNRCSKKQKSVVEQSDMKERFKDTGFKRTGSLKQSERENRSQVIRSSSTERKHQRSKGTMNTTMSMDYCNWNQIEQELKEFRARGYDPDMAVMALLSNISTSKTNARLDWRKFTRSQDTDYFSVYPWSMRKKDRSSSRLGEYLQQCVNENSVEDLSFGAQNQKTPDGRRPDGPSGSTYVQNPRGYIKKDKSKTPGEVAIDEARVKNSKNNKGSLENIAPLKTNISSNVTENKFSPRVDYEPDTFRLPDIPKNKPPHMGKLYSGINRLTTPPTNLKNASSIPSLNQSHSRITSPLQVKNCGIPKREQYPFTPLFRGSLSRSQSDIYGNTYAFSNGDVSNRKSAESNGSITRYLSYRRLIGRDVNHHEILKNMYEKTTKEPPKPPPVTPNVRRGMTRVSRDDPSYKPLTSSVKLDVPMNSRRSSFNVGYHQDSDSTSDDEDWVEKSSIHSLTSMGSVY